MSAPARSRTETRGLEDRDAFSYTTGACVRAPGVGFEPTPWRINNPLGCQLPDPGRKVGSRKTEVGREAGRPKTAEFPQQDLHLHLRPRGRHPQLLEDEGLRRAIGEDEGRKTGGRTGESQREESHLLATKGAGFTGRIRSYSGALGSLRVAAGLGAGR